MKKKVRHSIASYHTEEGPTCDLVELANKLKNIGEVPEYVGFTKAGEIALLARNFLVLYKIAEKLGKVKKK